MSNFPSFRWGQLGQPWNAVTHKCHTRSTWLSKQPLRRPFNSMPAIKTALLKFEFYFERENVAPIRYHPPHLSCETLTLCSFLGIWEHGLFIICFIHLFRFQFTCNLICPKKLLFFFFFRLDVWFSCVVYEKNASEWMNGFLYKKCAI